MQGVHITGVKSDHYTLNTFTLYIVDVSGVVLNDILLFSLICLFNHMLIQTLVNLSNYAWSALAN